jgi:autotransporter-associated beta strand protein
MNNATAGNESFSTTWNLMGGTMTSSGGGAYNIDGATGYSINSLATNISAVISGNIAMRSAGLVISTDQGTVPNGIDLSITGNITDNGGNTLGKSGNGTLSLSGVNTFNGDININAGKLRIDGTGSLNSGNYTAHLFINGTDFSYNSSASQTLGAISGSGTLTMNGNGTLSLNSVNDYTGATTVNGGTLAGTGTIAGVVTNNSGGTLSPGAGGVGTLTVYSNLVMKTGSTNVFEVNGTTLAKDVIAAGGNVTYGGVLKIVPTGTFAANQTFALFSGAGTTNASNFSSIVGSPGSGLGFTFTNGTLKVVATVNTSSTNITSSVSGNLLTLSWPADHTGWRLQVQTNSASAGLQGNWVDVPGSTSVNTVSITINPANGTVFYRMVYP